MSDTVRGWCPSLHEPMQAADGWLARVKPTGGVLTASDAHALAEGASRCGNGLISLTSRGNLQFRGLTQETARDFAAMVVARGLASADPAAERRRTVLASPGLRDLAADMEAMLTGETGFSALPAKFGVSLDGGTIPVRGAPSDLLVRIDGDEALLEFGPATRCPTRDAVATTRRLIAAMLNHGGGRMRDHGPELITALNLPLVTQHAPPSPPPITGPHTTGFGIGLAFGDMDADALTELAHIAQTQGDGTLQLTPWRFVLLPGVTAPATANPLLITDPANPILSVAACVGRPACARATVFTRRDATRLAKLARADLHVSGCAKGCARATQAAITLVGRDGRYDWVRNGRADDTPHRLSLSIDDIEALLQ